MGQEKSLPERYNTQSDYKTTCNHCTKNTPFSHRSSTEIRATIPPTPCSGRTLSSEVTGTTDSSRSFSTTSTSCSVCSTSTTASNKSLDKQKNYLDHQLYIKSYLDILEEDSEAKKKFIPAKQGIRNYTPKILSEKQRNNKKKQVDAWI